MREFREFEIKLKSQARANPKLARLTTALVAVLGVYSFMHEKEYSMQNVLAGLNCLNAFKAVFLPDPADTLKFGVRCMTNVKLLRSSVSFLSNLGGITTIVSGIEFGYAARRNR